jgi:glycosyltransferase involved in cell wall biosynthesis
VPDFSESNIRDNEAVIATIMQTADEVAKYSESKGRQYYFIQHREGLYHGEKEDEVRAFGYPMKKIVVSTWLKEILENEYLSKPELLINPIDRDVFFRVARTIKMDKIRILMLHHTYEWKGTREGAKMVNELKGKYPNVELVMYGARNPKVDPEIGCDEYFFNPPQKKLAWIFSNSDIFLCTSWDEGFGLPSLEAMHCLCAVATYDNGGSRDFAFDDKTALVAKRRDYHELKSKLERLISDKELRSRIANAGHDYALKMPTWDEQTARLENILMT